MSNTANIGISLGWTCNSAMFAVSKGIRNVKKSGYKTCPFDKMISNYTGLLECISDDFKYFVDPEYLTLKCLIRPNGTKDDMIYNTKYNFFFNHESPGHADLYKKEKWPNGKFHFVDNNYLEFIKRYTNRIENFRNYLIDPKNRITFVITIFSGKL